MYDDVLRLLLNEGVRFVHTTNKVLGKTLTALKDEYPLAVSEVSLDAKTAYELSLAGSYAAKRTACVFSTEGLYDALDPIMSSAYTGVTGGLLIVAFREIEEEATPVGPFSKLPVLVAEGTEAIGRAIRFGFAISEKYEIPVVIQAKVLLSEWRSVPEGPPRSDTERTPGPATAGKSRFIKDPDRWAALPRFRFALHRQLNEKIEQIREEFESYEGNVTVRKARTGIITCTRSAAEFFDEDASMLCLSTVFPLPLKLVDAFVAEMDEVFMAEGPYPVIEHQIRDRSKIFRGPTFAPRKKTKPEETMYGFSVVRDTLGAASSINMAHGMKKLDPERKVLAVTFEDYFFQAGMPALVNTMHNGSSYVLLVLGSTREEEAERLMRAYGCDSFHHIRDVAEIKRFTDHEGMTVLFYKGII
jgi:TPP-dependent indolepyruvate ferredoxin oxidoreductase alpha subunit